MLARWRTRRSAATGVDGVGRSVSKDATGGIAERDDGTGSGASQLADGQPHHHRFGYDDEQRIRNYRGTLAVWNAPGANRSSGSSAIHDSFHGRIRGWFRFSATWPNGHAHAYPICVNLSREGGI